MVERQTRIARWGCRDRALLNSVVSTNIALISQIGTGLLMWAGNRIMN